MTAEQVEQAKTWIDEGIPKTKVAERLGVGRTTLYEYIKAKNPRKPR
ncbi:helix-turn-helix domain-containing protein [Corynebacterium propinquum]